MSPSSESLRPVHPSHHVAVVLLALSALAPIGAAVSTDAWTGADAVATGSVTMGLALLLEKLRHQKIVRLALVLLFLSFPGTIHSLFYWSKGGGRLSRGPVGHG